MPALSAEPDDNLTRRAGEVVRREAIEEDGLANWPPIASMPLEHPRTGEIRTQWCHGAPGIITSLTHLLDEDLALAGGYAFLTLFERTGDERWLSRARSFAMHAVEQVEKAHSQHRRGRYTLWAGDAGTALYLADCLEGTGALPLP